MTRPSLLVTMPASIDAGMPATSPRGFREAFLRNPATCVALYVWLAAIVANVAGG